MAVHELGRGGTLKVWRREQQADSETIGSSHGRIEGETNWNKSQLGKKVEEKLRRRKDAAT